MLRDERLERTMDLIRSNKYTSIKRLMDTFGVSRATMRRDLEIISSLSNDLQLTRGGIICNGASDDLIEPPYIEKKVANVEEKKRIGKAACELVLPNTTIMIDTGTTTIEMIEHLKTIDNIHVVTDDILIAAALTSNKNVRITMLGGEIRSDFYNVRGYYAEIILKELHFDQSFLSIDAVDPNVGCMISNVDEVALKKTVIQNSSQSIMLCDHTKFSSRAFIKVCNICDIDLYITGMELNSDIQKKLQSAGCNIKTV